MEQVYIGTTNYGRHWLSRPAAEAWARMVRDGCPPQGITDAGRTQGEQETLFRKHFTTNYAASARIDRRVWAGQVWYRAYRPGTRTPWPSAATPGSPQARHQWGLSLDLNGATKAWVRANGHRYGWIKDIVRGEDWHMEYQASRDAVLVSNPGATIGGTLPNVNVTAPTPIAPTEEDDDMKRLLLVQKARTPEVYVTDLVVRRHVRNEYELNQLKTWIRHLGGDDTVHVVDNLDTFGPLVSG